MIKKEFIKRSIKIDWVLKKELAVGPAPKSFQDIDILKNDNIVAILSLCSLEELDFKENLNDYFKHKRLVLPDHKYKEDPTIEKLNKALDMLEELKNFGPVYVHCVCFKRKIPFSLHGMARKKHNLTPTPGPRLHDGNT